MYVEKRQAEIIFRAKDNQKGLTINIATGEVLSLATGRLYAYQNDNHVKRLFGNNEPIPQVFHNSHGNILQYDEPTAIVGLYYMLDTHEREQLPFYITVLQMFYNRQFAISFRRVMIASEILLNNRHFQRPLFVNYIIANELHDFDRNTLTEQYRTSLTNIDVSDLNNDQRRFVCFMLEHNMATEKIEYVIRKMKAEHIEFVIGLSMLEEYFNLCDLLEQSYNQRNFLNGLANMLYYKSIHKDELLSKKVKLVQKDIFKMDNEKYYCVMPTTPQEFRDMGRIMRNCIGGYYDNVATGRSIIVFVYDRETNRPIINIEIGNNGNRGYTIRQFNGMSNRYVQDTYRDFYTAYCTHLMNIQE